METVSDFIFFGSKINADSDCSHKIKRWLLLELLGVSLMVQLVKNPPAMWETQVQSLGWEDPLEKGKTTHSSILAWRIPRGVCKELDMTEQHLFCSLEE